MITTGVLVRSPVPSGIFVGRSISCGRLLTTANCPASRLTTEVSEECTRHSRL